MEKFSDYCLKLKHDFVFDHAYSISKYFQVHNIHELKDRKKHWKAYFLQGNKLHINRKHCYSLKHESALRILLKEGFIKQLRDGYRHSKSTVLILNINENKN